MSSTAQAGDVPLTLPEGRVAIIDLNNRIIDRALSGEQDDGCVIRNRGTLTIRDDSKRGEGTIKGGRNAGSGGAVDNRGTLIIEKGIFTDNEAQEGGAVFNATDATLKVTGGVFSQNRAAQCGGGFVNCGTMEFAGGTVTGNTVPMNGAGIWSAGELTLSGGSITGNSATATNGSGGGLYFSSGSCSIQGKLFHPGQADHPGQCAQQRLSP